MPGLVVIGVDANGQADKLGMRMHDVLYKSNGHVLESVNDIVAGANEDRDLMIIRGRQIIDLKVAKGSLGLSLVPYPIQDVLIDGVGEVISKLLNAEEEKDKAAIEERRRMIEEETLNRIASIKITTAHQLEGYRVLDTLEVITAEYVSGVNFIREFFAGITDVVGGRSGSLQNELREARLACLIDLRYEADRIGANAIIGVNLDYSEISGDGKSMLFLVASGTAVVVEKEGK
jgi:uncharacterized protein YbjQ (UPF0145 family)